MLPELPCTFFRKLPPFFLQMIVQQDQDNSCSVVLIHATIVPLASGLTFFWKFLRMLEYDHSCLNFIMELILFVLQGQIGAFPLFIFCRKFAMESLIYYQIVWLCEKNQNCPSFFSEWGSYEEPSQQLCEPLQWGRLKYYRVTLMEFWCRSEGRKHITPRQWDPFKSCENNLTGFHWVLIS